MRHANCDPDQNFDPGSMLDSWYRNYSSELRAYIFKHLRDHELADDLMHDTFLIAAQKAAQYVESGQSRAFLYSITKRLMLSASRRRKRTLPHQVIADENLIGDSIENSGSEQFECQRHRQQLADAIDLLPSNDREIIELRFQKKLKFNAIAHLLQIPMNTAVSRLHRAISKIRKQML